LDLAFDVNGGRSRVACPAEEATRCQDCAYVSFIIHDHLRLTYSPTKAMNKHRLSSTLAVLLNQPRLRAEGMKRGW
jgi:hypothetical protein